MWFSYVLTYSARIIVYWAILPCDWHEFKINQLNSTKSSVDTKNEAKFQFSYNTLFELL
jgi:hypothetical protein